MNPDDVSLFDDVPGARNTDPATSHAAAENVAFRSGSHRARLLDVYGDRDNWDGLTDEEAAIRAGLSPRSCWWKRCSELRALGMIAPTGETRESSAGEHGQVCAITADGMRARAELRRGA